MNPSFPGGIQKVNIFPSGSKALPVLLFFSITGGRYISLLSETSEQHDEDTPACNSVKRGLTCTKLMKEKQLAPVFQSQTRPLLSQLLFTIGNHKSRLPLWMFQSELDDKKKQNVLDPIKDNGNNLFQINHQVERSGLFFGEADWMRRSWASWASDTNTHWDTARHTN